MNQEKIGKFIATERKKKKLTQIELAEKIGVSNSAVSKWETGNGMPDYSVFSNLCKTLDISVNELLTGEKNVKDDEIISKYMKHREKKNKGKLTSVIVASVLTLLCFVFGTFFFNSYKSITMYEFIGENDNFRYEDATYLESKIKTVFTGGQFKIMSGDIKETDIIDKKLAIKVNDQYYWFGNVYAGSLDYEEYLYGDKFTKPELEHLPNDLYLIIWYKLDNKIKHDEIKLNAKVILSNDKIVDLKTEDIGAKPTTKLNGLINLEKYNSSNKYKEWLFEQGFIEANTCKDKEVECPILKKTIDDETIYINYMEKTFEYGRTGDINIISPPHCYDKRESGMKCTTDGNKRIEIGVWEINKDGNHFHMSKFYDIEENTLNYKKIDESNEKYMTYINRARELYEKYRPQEE